MPANGYKIIEASQIVDLSRATVYKYLNEFQTIFKDSIRDVDGVRYIDDEGLYLLKKIKALKVHKNISLNDIETELLKEKYGQCHTDNNGVDNGVETKSLKMENALLKEQNETLHEDIRFLREQQQELIRTDCSHNPPCKCLITTKLPPRHKDTKVDELES